MTERGTPDIQLIAQRLEKLEGKSHRLKQAAWLGSLSIALLVLLGQSGCPTEQPKQSPTPIEGSAVHQPYQRFVRIASAPAMTLNWALDTKTGEVCRTWDWSVPGDKPGENGREDVALAAPTCYELYTEFPDSK